MGTVWSSEQQLTCESDEALEYGHARDEAALRADLRDHPQRLQIDQLQQQQHRRNKRIIRQEASATW